MGEFDRGRRLSQSPAYWPFRRIYYGWAVTYSSVVANFFHVPMYGPVLAVFVKPIGDDMGWTRWEISLGFTIGSFVASIASPAIGRFIDKHGARGIVMIAGVVVAGMLLGLASMSEPWQMWVYFGVGRGAAMAGVNLATGVAVANWFIKRRGRAMAVHAVGLRAGQALVPLIALPIMINYSWRHAYVALSAMALLFIILPAFMYIRRRPEDLGLQPDGEPAEVERESAANQKGRWPRKKVTDFSFTLGEALRTKAFWLIVIATAGAAFVQTAVNLHAVANFQDKGMDQALAVTIATIFTGTSAISLMAWGFFYERIHVRWGAVLASSIQVLAMVLLVVADDYPTAVLFGFVYGIGVGGWTVLFSLIFPDYFGRLHTGQIRGFSMPVMGLLNPLGPLLAALVRDFTGSYSIAFGAFSVLFALTVIAMLFAKPPRLPVRGTPLESM